MVFIALSGNHEPMRMILITDTGPAEGVSA